VDGWTARGRQTGRQAGTRKEGIRSKGGFEQEEGGREGGSEARKN